MQHQFFQGFFPPQNVQTNNRTSEMDYNEMVIEISNNWGEIKNLIEEIKTGKVNTVNNLEKEWLNFINSNGINISTFKNEKDFIEKNLKPLVNEK